MFDLTTLTTARSEEEPALQVLTEKTLITDKVELPDFEFKAARPRVDHLITEAVAQILNETIEKETIIALPVAAEITDKDVRNIVIPEETVPETPDITFSPEPPPQKIELPVTSPVFEPQASQQGSETALDPAKEQTLEAAEEQLPLTLELSDMFENSNIEDNENLNATEFGLVAGMDQEAMDASATEFEVVDHETEADWVEMAIHDILGEATERPDVLVSSEDALMPEYAPEWLKTDRDKTVAHEEQVILIQEQLSEFIEPLQPKEAEAAIDSVVVIVQTVRMLREQLAEEVSETETLEIEPQIEELKQIFEQLLETLGLVLEDEQLEVFICFLLRDERTRVDKKQLLLLEEGTHEQKQAVPTFLNILTQLVSQGPKTSLHNLVGRLALQFKVQLHRPKLSRTQASALAAA